jgi:HAD superfamily hydrolase (TIGR01509 family)
VEEQSPLPGAKELIQKASEEGLTLGIVSSSDRDWVEKHLTRLDLRDYFDDVSCADDVVEAKPDPALYHLGLKKMDGTPEKVIVLEDSPYGVLAAKRAGLYCVAVPNTITRQLPYFEDGGSPDLILDSLKSFPWDEFMKEQE